MKSTQVNLVDDSHRIFVTSDEAANGWVCSIRDTAGAQAETENWRPGQGKRNRHGLDDPLVSVLHTRMKR